MISRRFFSVSRGHYTYAQQLHSAVENVNVLLEQNDRSSYLLAQYIPEPARTAFMAIRAFGLEVNKISSTQRTGMAAADLKFKFWSDLVSSAFAGRATGEPVAFLLRDAADRGLNLDAAPFLQFLQTRRHFLRTPQFASAEAICSYGEGTYSQLNYAVQGLLLSPGISPSSIELLESSSHLQKEVGDVAAHIGQATAVASMLLGLPYYASRDIVTVPVDIMAKNGLSQENTLRLVQGHLEGNEQKHAREQLQNVVYETAVFANDHILSARRKLAQLPDEIRKVVESKPDGLLPRQSKRWRRGLPDALFTPFMSAIPTALYLRKLEKHDFDVLSPKLQQKEWRLAWTSFKSYYRRTI
ncbi:putative SAGA-associated factor [Clavispora lusitaniae]|uniref:SAGA-associated factor n=1 Tax=Clavispora lusitaniae TaxID=36911 RepID=A0AA91Q2M1_CLALS|nr:putative SAGA-associated factor [Clavispora lusitaniae]